MESKKKIPAKRVNVVSLKVVKESSVLYETRNITNPYDAFRLVKSFIDPSVEDENITRRLKECGEILGIGLIDHIILGDRDRYFSFKENNKI